MKRLLILKCPALKLLQYSVNVLYNYYPLGYSMIANGQQWFKWVVMIPQVRKSFERFLKKQTTLKTSKTVLQA